MIGLVAAKLGAFNASAEAAEGDGHRTLPQVSAGAGLGTWIAGEARQEADFGLGLLPHAGVGIARPLWLEAEVAFAAAKGGGIRYAPRAQAVFLLAPGSTYRPGILAGLGVQGANAADPTVAAPARVTPHWGVTASVDTSEALHGVKGAPAPWLRFDARDSIYAMADGDAQHNVGVFVGLEYVSRKAPVVIDVVEDEEPPAPAPPPPGEGVTISPAIDVWLSHPVCAWVPSAEAPALIAAAPGPVTLSAPGYLPIEVRPDQTGPVTLPPAPKQRGLVVAALPGDRLTLDGKPVSLDPRGDAVLASLDGLAAPGADITLVVKGGGRSATTQLAPVDGWGVWYRPPSPADWEIRFGAGSADLGAAAKTRIAELAQNAGDWTYALRGSYSPEGNKAANDSLAARRAEAVRSALVAAGLPSGQIRIDPSAARTGVSAEAARVVLVTPIPRPEP